MEVLGQYGGDVEWEVVGDCVGGSVMKGAPIIRPRIKIPESHSFFRVLGLLLIFNILLHNKTHSMFQGFLMQCSFSGHCYFSDRGLGWQILFLIAQPKIGTWRFLLLARFGPALVLRQFFRCQWSSGLFQMFFLLKFINSLKEAFQEPLL
jgi:hypothetical protein